MAAKKARAEKTVLSRQEIASRRRALTEKKLTTGGAGRRAIAGVFLLAGGLLTLLSLFTFDVRDRVGPGFHNAAGPVGHALSDGLLGLLGYCAYVVPLALVYAAVVIFVGARDKRRWPQLLAVALLVVSSAVLAQLAFAHSPACSMSGRSRLRSGACASGPRTIISAPSPPSFGWSCRRRRLSKGRGNSSNIARRMSFRNA